MWVWSKRRTAVRLFHGEKYHSFECSCSVRPLFDTRARTHTLTQNRPRMAWECFLQPLWLPLVTSEMVFINYVDSELLLSWSVSFSSSPSLSLSLSSPLLPFPFFPHSLRLFSLQPGLGFGFYIDMGALAEDYCGVSSSLMMMYNNLLSFTFCSPRWLFQRRNQTS